MGLLFLMKKANGIPWRNFCISPQNGKEPVSKIASISGEVSRVPAL